jgi:hypothetical protein
VIPFPTVAAKAETPEVEPEPEAPEAGPSPGAVDREQIGAFVEALFLHVSEGGTVSIRAFYDDELAKKRGEKPFAIRPVRLNGGGLEPTPFTLRS